MLTFASSRLPPFSSESTPPVAPPTAPSHRRPRRRLHRSHRRPRRAARTGCAADRAAGPSPRRRRRRPRRRPHRRGTVDRAAVAPPTAPSTAPVAPSTAPPAVPVAPSTAPAAPVAPRAGGRAAGVGRRASRASRRCRHAAVAAARRRRAASVPGCCPGRSSACCGAVASALPLMPWSIEPCWCARLDRLRVGAQDVRRGRRLDRRGDVEVRRDREVDGRREVEPEVDVRVHVEQREHFLVRERDGVLRLDLVHGYAVAVLVHRGTPIARSDCLTAFPNPRGEKRRWTDGRSVLRRNDVRADGDPTSRRDDLAGLRARWSSATTACGAAAGAWASTRRASGATRPRHRTAPRRSAACARAARTPRSSSTATTASAGASSARRTSCRASSTGAPTSTGSTALPDWRITCFFVDKGYRRQGVAAAALGGALERDRAARRRDRRELPRGHRRPQGLRVVPPQRHRGDVRAPRLRAHPPPRQAPLGRRQGAPAAYVNDANRVRGGSARCLSAL